jgi:hypothetical protein
LIKKCAMQLRTIYLQISKHQLKVANILEPHLLELRNAEKDKTFTVELQKFLVLISLQPTFLGRCGLIFKGSLSVEDILRRGLGGQELALANGQEHLLLMCNNVRNLIEEVGDGIGFIQSLMFDITKIKQEGVITSKIYDDLITFIFNVKKDIVSPVLKEILMEIIRNYKAKKISLELLLQEVIAYTLLLTFGEFWDYANCLYKSERQKQINILLFRSDERFRTYLQDLYSTVLNMVLAIVVAEKNAEDMFAAYKTINEFVTLPVLPESKSPEFGASISRGRGLNQGTRSRSCRCCCRSRPRSCGTCSRTSSSATSTRSSSCSSTSS